MNHDDIVAGLVQELRRGNLILLVLNRLQKPMYGYNLVKELQAHDIPIEATLCIRLCADLNRRDFLPANGKQAKQSPENTTKRRGWLNCSQQNNRAMESIYANVEKLLSEGENQND